MIERLILRGLIENKSYSRRVLPYLKPSYFKEPGAKELFSLVETYTNKYSSLPNFTVLEAELVESKFDEVVFDRVEDFLGAVKDADSADEDWLIQKTEEYCKERALYEAIYTSIQIIDGKQKDVKKSAIPEIINSALAVSFNPSIGHDYYENAEERFYYYSDTEQRIPFDIEILNTITKGGVPRKTLNVCLAGINVGKTMFLCSLAASYYLQGYNVLYITAEVAEKEISRRLDANLLDIDIEELDTIEKDLYFSKLKNLKKYNVGKIITKEYPTASASAADIRALLIELKIKSGFVPDVVIIDYLNIMASVRYRGETGSYGIMKSISEELRGLAVEFNYACWTATQLNREGFKSSDVEMSDTAESFGVPATADFMFSLTTNEQLELLGQLMFKQLKSRYRNKAKNRKFALGVDMAKQRLYELDDTKNINIDAKVTKKDPAAIYRSVFEE